MERSGDRRDAPRGRGLRRGDRLRAASRASTCRCCAREMTVEIGATPLTLDSLRAIARDGAPIALAPACASRHRGFGALPSTASSQAARPPTASTPASAGSRRPGSPPTSSSSCRPTSCCRTPPAPARCSTTRSCASCSRSRSRASRAAPPACDPSSSSCSLALYERGDLSVHPLEGLGRRVRRSRAARAPRARPARHRRRAGSASERIPARDALRRVGPRPAASRAQGGARAPQRHAGLDRARADRALRGRGRVRRRGGRRRAVGRCRRRQRHAVRSAHPRAARPRRAARGGRALPRAASPTARSAARTSRTIRACRTRTACAASRR